MRIVSGFGRDKATQAYRRPTTPAITPSTTAKRIKAIETTISKAIQQSTGVNTWNQVQSKVGLISFKAANKTVRRTIRSRMVLIMRVVSGFGRDKASLVFNLFNECLILTLPHCESKLFSIAPVIEVVLTRTYPS